jgi:hypothetical protein
MVMSTSRISQTLRTTTPRVEVPSDADLIDECSQLTSKFVGFFDLLSSNRTIIHRVASNYGCNGKSKRQMPTWWNYASLCTVAAACLKTKRNLFVDGEDANKTSESNNASIVPEAVPRLPSFLSVELSIYAPSNDGALFGIGCFSQQGQIIMLLLTGDYYSNQKGSSSLNTLSLSKREPWKSSRGMRDNALC